MIDRAAPAERVQQAKLVEGAAIALSGGGAEQLLGPGIVGRNAWPALGIDLAEIVLRLGEALRRRFLEPIAGRQNVGLDAVAILVGRAHYVLGVGVAGLGRRAQHGQRRREIAGEVLQAGIVDWAGMGGGRQEKDKGSEKSGHAGLRLGSAGTFAEPG